MREGETIGECEKSLRLLYQAAMGQASNPDADPRHLMKFIDGLPVRWRNIISAEMRDCVLGDSGALSHAQRLEAAEKLRLSEPFLGLQLRSISAVQEASASGTSALAADIVQLQTKLEALILLVQDFWQSQPRKEGSRKSRQKEDSDTSLSSDEEWHRRSRTRKPKVHSNSSRSRVVCGYCKKSEHTPEQCRYLQRKTCEKCGKAGHATAYCQKRDVSYGKSKSCTFSKRSMYDQGN